MTAIYNQRAFSAAQSRYDNACPPDDPEYDEDELCACDLELTVSELDSGKCACCGKLVLA